MLSPNEYFLTLGYYKLVFSSACGLYKLQTSSFLGRFWGLVVGWSLFEVFCFVEFFLRNTGSVFRCFCIYFNKVYSVLEEGPCKAI